MLFITLHRDDYVMIGDTRVRYVRNKGSNSFTIEIDTPEGVTITRDKQYEALLTHHADKGDARAVFMLDQLQTEKETRRQLTAVRKAKQLST